MVLVNATGITDWLPDHLPDLSGKLFIITGGNSGIGLEAAKIFADRNADIVIAARNPDKVSIACAQLDTRGKGSASTLLLDLADMKSVRAAAQEAKERFGVVAALINNAGVMQTPPQQTSDGFEMQFGTNHLGHFLWTALMFERVDPANGRIVTVSSIAHKNGEIHFDDIMREASYDALSAYAQSKLANMLFFQELHRKLKAARSPIKAIGCHPGYSRTNLQSTGPTGAWIWLYKVTNALLAQSASRGAIPLLLAAAGQEASAGAYYGPTRLGDMRGPVGDSDVLPLALDEDAARRLWTLSETLTGEIFRV